MVQPDKSKGESGNCEGKDLKAGSWKWKAGSFWSVKSNGVLFFLDIRSIRN
jgi:hypothetical protein